MNAKTVLAVDPGSSKCGMALVRRNRAGILEVLWRSVTSTEELETKIDEACAIDKFTMVIVGNGTRSRTIVERLRDHMPSIGILVVDEKDTSMEARARYWEHHPRKGWRRFFPATMQTPPEPVDDFVAVILAERVIGE